MVSSFAFAQTPFIQFGPGKFSLLGDTILTFGRSVLIVTGASSFASSIYWSSLQEDLNAKGIRFYKESVANEPTPSIVDDIVQKYRNEKVDSVVAIGGGSVLDAGKAISAMLTTEGSVKLFLEGVGSKSPDGKKIPFIAVPTTSGTGSETTKNAVITEVGEHGFKRSLRHNSFVPNIAIVDPELSLNCPASITAQSGMDAFTQLLESYLSTSSNWMTDALAIQGLKRVRDSLLNAVKHGQDKEARAGMAFAAMISGITLANAGLGVVHGFASSIGSFFNAPHGAICGTLMAAGNSITVRKLRATKDLGPALNKYAEVGKLFSESGKSKEYYIDFLLNLINKYTEELKLPRLSKFGVTPNDFTKIIKVTENKNNPVKLNDDDLLEILEVRL